MAPKRGMTARWEEGGELFAQESKKRAAPAPEAQAASKKAKAPSQQKAAPAAPPAQPETTQGAKPMPAATPRERPPTTQPKATQGSKPTTNEGQAKRPPAQPKARSQPPPKARVEEEEQGEEEEEGQEEGREESKAPSQQAVSLTTPTGLKPKDALIRAPSEPELDDKACFALFTYEKKLRLEEVAVSPLNRHGDPPDGAHANALMRRLLEKRNSKSVCTSSLSATSRTQRTL